MCTYEPTNRSGARRPSGLFGVLDALGDRVAGVAASAMLRLQAVRDALGHVYPRITRRRHSLTALPQRLFATALTRYAAAAAGGPA